MPEFYTDEDWKIRQDFFADKGDDSWSDMAIKAKYDAGEIDDQGRRTIQETRNLQMLPEKYLKREGFIPDDKGFHEGFWDGVNRTSRQIASGTLKTFGQFETAKRIEDDLKYRKDLSPVDWGDSKMGWLGDSLGMGLTESAGMIVGSAASTALTGSPVIGAAVGASGTYVRMFGENHETLTRMNTMDLSEGEIMANTFLLTAFQSAVEVGFGMEASLGRVLGGGARTTGAKVLGDHLKTKAGKNLVRRMSKEFFNPQTIPSGLVSGGFKEYIEEVTQEWAAIGAEFKSSGKMPTKEEMLDRTLIQPLRAFPAGSLMGGGGAFMHTEVQGKEAQSIDPVTDDMVAAVHGVENVETGAIELDEKSLAEEENAFDALRKNISAVKKVSQEQAAETASFLREVAYSLSELARKHGIDKKPVDFINELSTVALKDTLTPEDIGIIKEIQMDTKMTAAEKGERIQNHIVARYGNTHSFYKMMKSIDQSAQLLTLDSLIGDLKKKMGVAGAVPFIDDKARKAFGKSTKSVILNIANSSAHVQKRIDDGLGFIFSASSVEDGVFSATQAAQLYVYGAEFEHNGHKYRVTIRDSRIAVLPAQEVADQEQAVTDVQTVVLERLQKEDQQRQELPTEEETGSDTALTQARADYAIIANKALGMEDFMEFWKNRHTAQAVADIDYGELANRTFTDSEGNSMTGAEIVALAREDAGRDMTLDEITLTHNALKLMDLDAYNLYVDTFIKEGSDFQEAINKDIDERKATVAEERARLDAIEDERIAAETAKRSGVINRIKGIIKFEGSPFAKALAGKKRVAPPQGADPLLQEQEGEGAIGGIFIPQSNTAIFFANSDAGSVIHEIMHHMSAQLPTEVKKEIQLSLADQVGVQQEIDANIIGNAFEEAFADSVNQYIIDGTFSPELSTEVRTAYENLSEAIGVFTKQLLADNGFVLSPKAKEFFDTFFEEVSTEEIHTLMASSAMSGVQMAPPTDNTVLEGDDFDGETLVGEEGAPLLQGDKKIDADLFIKRAGEIEAKLYADKKVYENGKWKKAKSSDDIDVDGLFTYESYTSGFVLMKDGFDDTWHILMEYTVGDEIDYQAINDGTVGESEDLGEKGRANAILDLAGQAAKHEASRRAVREQIPLEEEGAPLLQSRQRLKPSVAEANSVENLERKRKGLLGHLHGAVDAQEGTDAHTILKAVAFEVFAEEFEGKTLDTFSLASLSHAQLRVLQKRIEPSKAGKVISAKSNEIVDTVVEDGVNRPTAEDPDKFYDKRTTRYAAKIEQKMRRLLDFNNSALINLAYYIRGLDGYRYIGAFGDMIMKPISKARQEGVRIQKAMQLEFGRIKEKHGVPIGYLSHKKNINIDGRMFSESQLVLMSMAGRQVNGKTSYAQLAIMESNTVPQEMFDAAVKHVASDQALTNHANYLIEAYGSLHAKLAPVYLHITGKKLPAIENYFPMIRIDGTWSEKDIISNLLESVAPAGHNIKSAQNARTKSRTQIKGSTIRMDNADDALISYASAAANYIAKAQIVKDISDAVATPKMGDHFRRVYGNERGDKMRGFLEKLISREMFANAKTTGMDDWQMVARDARNKFTFAMLGGRLMTMPKQTVSYFNYMARLSGAMSPRFMVNSLANSVSLTSTIMRNASINVALFAKGESKTHEFTHLLEGHRLHDMLKEYAPHIYDRHGNPETADFEQRNFKGALDIKWRGIKAGDLAMGGIKTFDMITVGTAWLSGFEFIQAQELAKGTEETKAAQIAADTINEMISDSQPPSVAHERTIGQTDNEYIRGLFPFSAQTMLNWQEWINGVLIPSVGLIKSHDVKGFFRSEGYNASIAQRLALGFIAPALALGVLARRRWPKDKEEMVFDAFFYPLSMMPVFGAPLVHGLESGWREADLAPIYLQVPADLIKATIDYANFLVRDGEFGAKEQKNFLGAASVVMSVPTAYTHFLHTLATEYAKDGWDSLSDRAVFLDAIGAKVAD